MWSLFLKLSRFKCSRLSNSGTSSTQTGRDAFFKHFPFPVSHGRILQSTPPPPSSMSVSALRAACCFSAEKGQGSSAEGTQPGQHPAPDPCLEEKAEAVEKRGSHESIDQPVTKPHFPNLCKQHKTSSSYLPLVTRMCQHVSMSACLAAA